MFTRPRVKSTLARFVAAKLLTDSTRNGPENQKLQTERYKLSPALPAYLVLTSEGKVIETLIGMERDEDAFLAFLEKGLK